MRYINFAFAIFVSVLFSESFIENFIYISEENIQKEVDLMELEKMFQQPTVRIRNLAEVEKKVKLLAQDGPHRLQIISDFDGTMSKYKYKGKKGPSSHEILQTNSLIPNDIKKDFASLTAKYYAIEIDHTMSEEERIPHMIEWNRLGYELYYKSNLKETDLPQMVRESIIALREGCCEMMDHLHQHNIPLLIFSAGVGNVLREVLRQKATLHPNMKIVSNFMKFNEKGVADGFKGDLIHTFNKNENALKDSDYFDEIKHRNNVVLMGDMLGDLTMANGVPDINVCLKIGFLNAKFAELLDDYMDNFDIVLVDDSTMDVFNEILKVITI